MLLTGTLICENCKSNIEWEYIVPQKLSEEFLQAETLDESKAHPVRMCKMNENEYLLRLRCKNCDSVNEFIIYSERYL